MIDICFSNNQTTTVCAASSSSPQVVYAECSLEHQATRRTTTGFFVEDILHPDFGVKRPTCWQPHDSVRLNASLSSLSTDTQRSTLPSSSAQPTTTAACLTLRREATRRWRTANDSGKEPLNVETLPAWIFCTRYSDRPSSGRDISQFTQLHYQFVVDYFSSCCSAVAASSAILCTHRATRHIMAYK